MVNVYFDVGARTDVQKFGDRCPKMARQNDGVESATAAKFEFAIRRSARF
jgi:hypothetical protein